MRTDYPERYRILGLKIAYYRKRAGYTQEAFAEKIGRSNNFVSQVEGVGTTKGVSLETLFKMADVLGVAVNELLKD
ncbi:helix-turn-helix domain-containing protein [Bittarella massiliensis (ex Durand et al. 2017)]|uniref:helix-turn-helix domain-containing protein n=1 Tax=Bittarella massiliensis (ex Durand et al. 2017) TaxID=1720313 RepID=UPI001AA1B878|nr:helix-turn-helix transcriptional regulator [Bittarella massiliensis (ex Durand et al. 2017)]